MKRLILLAIFLGMSSVAAGEVSVRVCEADGNTPFDGRDIMVGTKLTIIVDSNVAEDWLGGLAVVDANMDYGVLSARDYNDITLDWEGSRFPAAGVGASVYTWQEGPDPDIDGFTLYTGYMGIVDGDWFIIDYNAINIGACNMGYYDFNISTDEPIYYLSFSHVRTRDFNNDKIVDFKDFAILASYWRETNCSDSDDCEGTDLDTDRNIDLHDLKMFADFWLEKTR
ncbi:MAG: hypothetical protein ACYS6W_05555 [Planctomycetota bacterium]|jgi:hypothetical protein